MPKLLSGTLPNLKRENQSNQLMPLPQRDRGSPTGTYTTPARPPTLRLPHSRQPSKPLTGMQPHQQPPVKLVQNGGYGHPSQAMELRADPQAESQRLPTGTILSNPADQELGSSQVPKTTGALRAECGGSGGAPGGSLGREQRPPGFSPTGSNSTRRPDERELRGRLAGRAQGTRARA